MYFKTFVLDVKIVHLPGTSSKTVQILFKFFSLAYGGGYRNFGLVKLNIFLFYIFYILISYIKVYYIIPQEKNP